jgi:hypothetical protein
MALWNSANIWEWRNKIMSFVLSQLQKRSWLCAPLNRPEHNTDTLATKKSGSNALRIFLVATYHTQRFCSSTSCRFKPSKVGRTSAWVKTCNSQDTMSATWRKEKSTVETSEIMKTAAHRSESWCWRQLLSLLSHVLTLVLTQSVCGWPKATHHNSCCECWRGHAPVCSKRIGLKTKLNSMAWVRKRNIPTDWATAACRRS